MSELTEYFQLGNADPADSYVPGDDKQRIDLDEFYRETEQDKITVMVMGSEALSLGKLSKRTAVLLGLKDADRYDPFPSERNARMGAEGFLSTVAEKFKDFIEAIIRYIRMAIDWVVDTIKTVFGFRKSDRINKAVNDSLDELKEEFAKTLTGLGFPATEYNVERFIGNLPANKDRVPQMVLLKNKFVSDQEAIKALAESYPVIQQCVGKLNQSSDRALKAANNLKKVIADEYNRTRVRRTTQGPLESDASPEVNRVYKACVETKAALDIKPIADQVKQLYEVLYKVEFNNDELMNGFDQVRKKLQGSIQAESMNLYNQDVGTLLATIQYLNSRYLAIKDNEIDLRGVNWKQIGSIIDKSDADKVRAIADFYKYPKLLAVYQEATVDVRNFTNFCYSTSQSLLQMEKQTSNLIEWFNRTHAYYYHGVLDEVDKLREIVLEARSKKLNPMADMFGNPTGHVFIKDADAKTFMERASAEANFIISNDLAGTKTIFNNFTKQIGWGKTL